MSYLSTLKTLILVSFISLLLGACSSGSGGLDSDHGLVPTPIAETNVTDTNTSAGGSGGGTNTHTAPDTNGTQSPDTNASTGGETNGTTGGGSDTNTSVGSDTNSTGGGSDDGNSTGGGTDANGTTGDSSNDGNATGGGDANTTTTPTVTLKSLKLTIAKISLNKDENTTAKVVATYSDNTTKEITDNIEWIVTPNDAVTIQVNTLTALKDTNVTLQAKMGNTLSNRVTLNIYWEVNGYRLPLEPDPEVNDATLGGVDTNHNGVRDDVERYIYKKYSVKLHQALLMDKARFFQKTLIEPLSQARKLAKENSKHIDCQIFLRHIDKTIHSDDWLEDGEKLKYIIFNTNKRARKYLDYNLALSGGVYGSNIKDWNRDACSEEVRKVLKEMGK